MLNVFELTVTLLTVIILNVVAPSICNLISQVKTPLELCAIKLLFIVKKFVSLALRIF